MDLTKKTFTIRQPFAIDIVYLYGSRNTVNREKNETKKVTISYLDGILISIAYDTIEDHDYTFILRFSIYQIPLVET